MTDERTQRIAEIRERASGFNRIHLTRDTSDILWLLAEVERLESERLQWRKALYLSHGNAAKAYSE